MSMMDVFILAVRFQKLSNHPFLLCRNFDRNSSQVGETLQYCCQYSAYWKLPSCDWTRNFGQVDWLIFSAHTYLLFIYVLYFFLIWTCRFFYIAFLVFSVYIFTQSCKYVQYKQRNLFMILLASPIWTCRFNVESCPRLYQQYNNSLQK